MAVPFRFPPTLSTSFFPSTRRVDFKSRGWCWERFCRYCWREERSETARNQRMRTSSLSHESTPRHKGACKTKSFLTPTTRQWHFPTSKIARKTLPRGQRYTKFFCLHILIASATWRIHLYIIWCCYLHSMLSWHKCWCGIPAALHIYLSIFWWWPIC